MSVALFLISVSIALIVFYLIKNYLLRVSIPLSLLLLSLVWGIFAGSLQGWLSPPIENPEAFIRLVAPIVEPLLKVIPLIYLVSRRQITSYREGILFGIGVGLGFSTADNYLFITNTDVLGVDQLGRMVTFNSIHAVSTGMMGFALSMGRGRRTWLDQFSPLIGVLIAAVWQLAFNVLSDSVSEERLVVVSLIFILGGTGLILTVIRTSQLSAEKQRANDLLEVVIPIGVDLSSEKEFGRLLERMTVEAINYCQADGGILYLRTDADELRFVSVRHERRNIALGGTTGQAVFVEPIPLHEQNDSLNGRTAAAFVALNNTSLNLTNIDQSTMYNFSDLAMGDYRPFSCLTLPLQNSQDSTIGVLQLFDARDPETDVIISFDDNLEAMMGSFSLLATAALEGYLREASLRHEYAQLTINIDGNKVKEEVQQIEDTDFFRDLQARARDLRRDSADS